MIDFNGPVVVTGTDTGVGKTVATAALAWRLSRSGRSVEVLKAAQTGDDDDAGVVERLAGVPARALARYPDPLAPLSAARRSGLDPVAMDDVVAAVKGSTSDTVLVEGAGGLLVQLGRDGWTAADLASTLGCPAVVVVRSGLGTLNHTALTLEALERRGVPASIMIGSWPAEPDLAERENLTDLPAERIAALPEGLGSLEPGEFRERLATVGFRLS
ncbi:dethiobiotin synthase [Salininema proteolyticum]|uniref:ATP-dependent dethiobiotin synthetase BioD n=1 Tax=Salininema proteolyticum TaxID=1607685 RepID=A0ABV8U2A3_9ACTN